MPAVDWKESGPQAVAETSRPAAIRMTGPVVLKTMEGAMTSRRFVDWAKILASRLGDGDVVFMDNLGAHHAPEARAALERHGVRVVYLPPYSPDLNPIEMVWSVVKSKLRRAARRTVARLKNLLLESGNRSVIESSLDSSRLAVMRNQRKRTLL